MWTLPSVKFYDKLHSISKDTRAWNDIIDYYANIRFRTACTSMFPKKRDTTSCIKKKEEQRIAHDLTNTSGIGHFIEGSSINYARILNSILDPQLAQFGCNTQYQNTNHLTPSPSGRYVTNGRPSANI